MFPLMGSIGRLDRRRVSDLQAQVLRLFCNPGSTLKALANSSPGLRQPWASSSNLATSRTLKEFAKVPATFSQRFQRYDSSLTKSQGCSNPGLELAYAFSVLPGTADVMSASGVLTQLLPLVGFPSFHKVYRRVVLTSLAQRR